MYKIAPYHKKRNFRIAEMVLNGFDQTSVANMEHLSKTRVSQITWKVCWKVWPELVEPYIDVSMKMTPLKANSAELIRRIREEEKKNV